MSDRNDPATLSPKVKCVDLALKRQVAKLLAFLNQ